jgi:aliphatic nitrilase
LRGGCHSAIISPEGRHLAPPLTEGEGMVVADLDMALINKRKRMMDSVGHYARPELLHLVLDASAHSAVETTATVPVVTNATNTAKPDPISQDPKVTLNVRETSNDAIQPAAAN